MFLDEGEDKKKKKNSAQQSSEGLPSFTFNISYCMESSWESNYDLYSLNAQIRTFCDPTTGVDMELQSSSQIAGSSSNKEPKKGMVLPFQPLSMAFNHINYYVDMPAVSHQTDSSSIVLSIFFKIVHNAEAILYFSCKYNMNLCIPRL